MFQKATKLQSRLRLALCGPAGSGKTYTALSVAEALGRVAVLDTERGSASKYSDRFSFDVVELSEYHPESYVEIIKGAEAEGYDVLVIDSLSHAWSGKGGALELKDKATARSRSGNSYTAWREVTPLHNALVDAILGCSCHVIVTMRSKVEYILEDNGKGSKTPRKVGMAPVQREGMDYEFDVVGDLDWNHTLVVSKSRCSELAGAVVKEPGAEFAQALARWVGTGEKAPEPPEPTGPTAPELRSLIYSQIKAQAWTVDQVRALLAIHGAEVATDLSPEAITAASHTLNTQTGDSWQETQA